jgi:hypothetical protein
VHSQQQGFGQQPLQQHQQHMSPGYSEMDRQLPPQPQRFGMS